MKKFKKIVISLITIFAFTIKVYAASGNLEVSSTSVYVGDSFTVTANIIAAAAWNVHVSASGPVSGCTINQADATSDAMDTNKTFSATCTATDEGTITIRLSGDVTSASDGNAVNISGSKSVSVSQKIAPSSSSNNNNNNNDNNDNDTPTKSTNNKIKELSVDGYSLVKINENSYTLTVPINISSINIQAEAEDSRAKVSGTGSHNINVGENNIVIVITSESGNENKINIKVTRNDEYYLEDLASILKDNLDDININIKSDTIISSQDLDKIKTSGKIVKFNYYDNDKNLMYSWIVDGSKIKDTNDLLTTISYDSENKKDILRLSNYADSLFINIKQTNSIPAGTRIRLYVGDKFDNNDLVNVYAYTKNNDKLDLINSKIEVENGYIEFDVIDAYDYIVTMSNVPYNNEVSTSNNESSLIVPIVFIVIILLLIAAIIYLLLRKKKENETNANDNITPTPNNNFENQNMTNLSNNYNTNNMNSNINTQYNNQNNNSI